MAWACDEADTEPLEVVEGIVESVDLKLTAVAGARIDVADAEGAPEERADLLIERAADAKQLIGLRRGLTHQADGGDFAKGLQHTAAAPTDPPRCRRG